MKIKRVVSFLIVFIIISINPVISSSFFYDTIGHWAFEDIYWASNDVKLFIGYGDGTFRPDNNISRSEYITILYRAAHVNGLIDEKNIKDNFDEFTYNDINKDYWAYKNIKEVYDFIYNSSSTVKFKDIFPEDNLEPNKFITREEAVLLTYAFSSHPIDNKKLNFMDINKEYKYREELTNIVNNGIIIGFPDNTFGPYNNISRAESTALIKRVFHEMAYLKEEYLLNIELIKNIYDEKYMYFGDYFKNRELSQDDVKYMKVISTLEILDLYGRIPYDERANYDLNTTQTLLKLRENDYWNTLGVNYYLIQSDEIDENSKKIYAKELTDMFLKRVDLKDNEFLKLLELMIEYIDDKEKVLLCLDNWQNSLVNEYEKLNILFLKEKIYIKNSDYKSLLNLLNDKSIDEEFKFSDLEHREIYIFNKAYALYKLESYDEAIATLKVEWEVMKKNEDYIINKEEVDKKFIGSIKRILNQKY